ncbi:MAG TPA: hypothetical protein VF283_09165 [Bryobacteraceae bacterium]
MKAFLALLLALAAGTIASAEWRPATQSELKSFIPPRAPVVKEHIETEFRTASAITNGQGKYVGGAVLITEGYAAAGKYSIFLITQVPLHVEGLRLPVGEYAIGWARHGNDALTVKFYIAQSGKFVGQVEAARMNRKGRIDSFRIYPPGGKDVIEIGRFGMQYKVP